MGVDFNLPSEPRFSMGPRLALAFAAIEIDVRTPMAARLERHAEFLGFAGARQPQPAPRETVSVGAFVDVQHRVFGELSVVVAAGTLTYDYSNDLATLRSNPAEGRVGLHLWMLGAGVGVGFRL
jgi:hypothetical protein